MKLVILTLAVVASLHETLALRLPLPFAKDQQPLDEQVLAPKVRNATLADVDAITDIIVDAFTPSPEQQYVLQFLDEYRQYHWECQRQELVDIMEAASDDQRIYINVIDAPVDDDSDEMKPVALAGWVLKTRGHSSTVQPLLQRLSTLAFAWPVSAAAPPGAEMARNCHLHLDMNLTRALQWQYEFNPYEKHYIEEAYDRQVYLALLATHPDYDGPWFGAAHCQWGKQLAKQWEKDLSEETGEEEKVNVTLMATPRGYELYSTIGFENIANLSFTRVEGDEPKELTWEEVMFYPGQD